MADKFGGQVSETVGIENFISVKATEGPKLVANLEEHVRDYEVDVMDNQKAVRLGSNGLYEVELEMVPYSRAVLSCWPQGSLAGNECSR